MRKYTIVSNQVRYNLIDRTAESILLEYFVQHNITVIAHSPLATGFSSIQARDHERVIDKVARARCKTAAQVALNWCISKSGIVTIPKSDSVEHVIENCEASDFRLPPEELRLLDEKVEYGRRVSVEDSLATHDARQGLQHLGKNQ